MLASTNFSASPLKSQKKIPWALLATTWLAFLLRTVNLAGQSLWRDEVDAIRFSSWTLPELIGGLFQTGHNGPLFFLLLRPWRNLAGDSEFALRYPSTLLGTLAIPLGFVLARQLGFSRRVELILGLLLATSPYLVWYGQEAKMYALLLAFVTLAFIAYLKALTGPTSLTPWFRRPTGVWPGVWWGIFVVATTLSFYTHILAPLMLIVYGLVAVWYHAHLRRRWRGWLISMICLTAPYIPLLLWQFPLLWNDFQSGHPFYSLSEEIFLLLQLYSSGLVRFIGLTAIILFVFLFLCGLFLRERVTRPGEPGQGHISPGQGWPTGKWPLYTTKRLTLAAWTLLPPLIVYLISLRVPVFEDRYLIYITPAFYLLIVIGLMMVRQHAAWLASLCLGLILAINLMGIWQQQRQPIKPDFRAVAEYLSGQPQPPSAIMVQIPYLQHTLNYYYQGDYTLLEGLWTNANKTEATVDTEMTTLTADLTDLWLVVSEEELWDNRRLSRSWLNEHAHLVDEIHFTRVDVYHYQLRPGTIDRPSLDTAGK